MTVSILFRITDKKAIEIATYFLLNSTNYHRASKLPMKRWLNSIKFIEQSGFLSTKFLLHYLCLICCYFQFIFITYVLFRTNCYSLIFLSLLFLFIMFIASILLLNKMLMKRFYTQFGDSI